MLNVSLRGSRCSVLISHVAEISSSMCPTPTSEEHLERIIWNMCSQTSWYMDSMLFWGLNVCTCRACGERPSRFRFYLVTGVKMCDCCAPSCEDVYGCCFPAIFTVPVSSRVCVRVRKLKLVREILLRPGVGVYSVHPKDLGVEVSCKYKVCKCLCAMQL